MSGERREGYREIDDESDVEHDVESDVESDAEIEVTELTAAGADGDTLEDMVVDARTADLWVVDAESETAESEAAETETAGFAADDTIELPVVDAEPEAVGPTDPVSPPAPPDPLLPRRVPSQNPGRAPRVARPAEQTVRHLLDVLKRLP